ncbi:unnamed protein product [Leptosia nina]|uniref:Uncharacterized protein n=1 Tax=Leptosia nina TaxID=320188 RepID=A0AAV1JBP6_9NEOP
MFREQQRDEEIGKLVSDLKDKKFLMNCKDLRVAGGIVKYSVRESLTHLPRLEWSVLEGLMIWEGKDLRESLRALLVDK